jgi:acyl dehydratase
VARGPRDRRGRRPKTGLVVVKTVVARGLYFEEIEPGAVFRHRPGRTLGEADNTLFSTLTMNPQSLHLDAAYSERTEFGQRLVNSLLTLSTMVGLSVSDLTQETTVANLGFGKVDFPRPVFAGDTINAETEILSARASRSRPEAGVVVFEHRALNQRGEVVAVAQRTALMHRAPADRAGSMR